VAWIQDRNGLRFGGHGTVLSTATLQASGSRDEPVCSVELWLEAALADNSGTILAFHAPGNPLQFSLHQSLTDLKLQFRSAGPAERPKTKKIYVNDVFRRERSVFVTITSGAEATFVYMNGALARTASGFRLTPRDCGGQLIVGDSPGQQDPWLGQVRGLAIYYSEIDAPAALRHYNSWTREGKPEVGRNERIAALYLFDERGGNRVDNRARPGADLFIPTTYTVVDKVFLEPFWDEFDPSWSYWKNVLKNIAGFVPLGSCFCAYFALVRKSKRAGIVTVLVGAAASLTIEVLQGYLPTRDSGTTDLITNTFGTWIGVLLYNALYNAAKARWNRRVL